jgi:hypothetical protein
MTHPMTWSDFYLICFAIGFCFSFFSFVLGGTRTGRWHLPHFHGQAHGHVQWQGSNMPSAAAAKGSPVAGHAPPAGPQGTGDHTASVHAQHGGHVSPFNFITLTAFLAWFGGAGYLLTRYSGMWVGFGLLVSIASGIVGGGIVFLFLTKVLMSPNENMDPADYEMVGVLGRVCSSIREGGTGELIYAQVGTRRVCGARSEDGTAIAKGTEVVVTRYEKGIAYVRLWSELAGEQ